MAVRSFLRLAVDEAPPDHSTIARTRRLIDLETHRTVFTWVQQRLVEAGRLTGKTIAIDATTLEANAAMRSIVRRDTGESDQAFLAGLATASGVETPTREGRCFRHQLLLPRPYLVLTKPLRLDIQCQRGASVKIGWKYLDD